jgi:hypothetical protein
VKEVRTPDATRMRTSLKFLLRFAVCFWAPDLRVLRRFVPRFFVETPSSELDPCDGVPLVGGHGQVACAQGRTSKSSSSSPSTATSSGASLSSLLIRLSRIRCLSASLARAILTVDFRLERRLTASMPACYAPVQGSGVRSRIPGAGRAWRVPVTRAAPGDDGHHRGPPCAGWWLFASDTLLVKPLPQRRLQSVCPRAWQRQAARLPPWR